MSAPHEELFVYLERDLVDTADPDVSAELDLLCRAAELANAEWSEQEAGRELARHATADDIRTAQSALLCELMRNPAVDLRGIRMSRILWVALDVAC